MKIPIELVSDGLITYFDELHISNSHRQFDHPKYTTLANNTIFLNHIFQNYFKESLFEDFIVVTGGTTEIAIRTFKACFLAILAGMEPDLPKYMWEKLLTQTELTINLLRQETLNPRMSAWEYYNGPFDYSATPMGSLGCKIVIHNTSHTRKSWDQRGREGFSIGPAIQNYRYIKAIDGKTKALIITDTAEYLHR